MKKLILAAAVLFSIVPAFAQKKDKKKFDLTNRAGDHIMLQFSSDYWSGAPDSISNRMKGLSRGLNMYIMLDKPFKGNPRFSAAFGVGVGSSSIFFEKTNVDVKAGGVRLPFTPLDSTNSFKKYKLTTVFLEAPIELRFCADPENDRKSIKAAIGVKVGTMLKAYTKGKTLRDKGGRVINSYTQKESNRRFFNGTRLSATARIGYGNFSLFGSFQINTLLKDGAGPEIRPFQIGLCLSGL
jgi:hypothetical protein